MSEPTHPEQASPFGPRAPFGWAVRVGLALVLASVPLALAAGLGHRLGAWGYRAGLLVLGAGLLSAVAAAVLCLFGMVAARGAARRDERRLALLGLLTGLTLLAVPFAIVGRGLTAPPIHDITTDFADPPQLDALLPLRLGAENDGRYAGATLAVRQRRAYPEIEPGFYREPPREVFAATEAAARTLGWQVIAAAPVEGRLEATDTTFWFGFVDDVVVRVTPESGGSRVDVRSLSRVGVGDLGANAARIQRFFRALRTRGLEPLH